MRRPVSGLDESRAIAILESPVKRDALRRTLGWDSGRLWATGGHLMTMPRSLWPLGIDDGGRDVLRAPVNPVRHAAIKAIGVAGGTPVWIATDYDQEGHVIAADIGRHCHNEVRRLPLRALTADGWIEACAAAHPLDRAAALPGRARATIDRLIGSGLSRPHQPVGRVLAAWANGHHHINPPIGEWRVSRPDAQGGRSWHGVHPAVGGGTAFTAGRAPSLPPAQSRGDRVGGGRIGGGRGLTTGGALLEASRHGWPASLAMAGMQSLHLDGRLSYPRTDGEMICREHAEPCLFDAWGRWIDPCLPALPALGRHEALHVLVPPDLTRPLPRLPTAPSVEAAAEFMEILVARREFLALHPALREISEDGLAYRWRASPPWPADEEKGYRAWSPETRVLWTCLEQGLGRPSTLAGHVTRIAAMSETLEDRAMEDRILAGATLGTKEPRGLDALASAICRRAGAKLLTAEFSRTLESRLNGLAEEPLPDAALDVDDDALAGWAVRKTLGAFPDLGVLLRPAAPGLIDNLPRQQPSDSVPAPAGPILEP